MKKSCIF